MANGFPTLFTYHPASVVGALLAGPPLHTAARRDAEPEPERPTVWARLRSRVTRRPVYRPLPAS